MVVTAGEEAVAATEEVVAATEEAVAATEEAVAATEEAVTATEEAVTAGWGEVDVPTTSTPPGRARSRTATTGSAPSADSLVTHRAFPSSLGGAPTSPLTGVPDWTGGMGEE